MRSNMRQSGWMGVILCLLMVGSTDVLGEVAEDPVRLLNPGQDPWHVLRYELEVGQTQRVEMTMQMAVTVNTQGFDSTTVIPDVVITSEVTVDEIDGEEIAYSGMYTDIEVRETPGSNPMVTQHMEQWMQGLDGATFEARVTDRGIVRSVTFDIAEGADPALAEMIDNLSQAMDQLSQPLPAEPVGIGGSWEVVTTPEVGGIRSTITTTQQLLAIEAGTYVIGTRVKMVAEEQPIEDPNMGQIGRLNRMESNGEGELHLRLDRAIPVSGSITSSAVSDMTMTMFGQETNMVQTMDMTMEVRELE